MGTINDFTEKATKVADESVRTATEFARTAVDAALSSYNTAYESAQSVMSQVETQVAHGQAVAQEYEGMAAAYWQKGLEYAAGYPVTTYAVLGGTAAISFPLTRRLLYRATLGRFRTDEGTFKRAEERIGTAAQAAEEYGKEMQKLEAIMIGAEEEMKRGMSKLKNTRKDMQRLLAGVVRNEKVAAAAFEDLRLMRGPENVKQLRAEAASKKALLKQQRSLLTKHINRIIGQDI